MEFKIEIVNNEDIPAFGGYLTPSVTDGTAKIMLNLNATFCAAIEFPEMQWKEMLAEHTVHELLHAFQEIFGRSFDEEEIEQAIHRARKYNISITETEPSESLPVWFEEEDDSGNTFWEADSPYHDNGTYFKWRLRQKLESNSICWYDDSDSELGKHPDEWVFIGDAKYALGQSHLGVLKDLAINGD